MTVTANNETRTHDDDAMRALVRDTIQDRGVSVYRVARDCGLHDQQLRGWIKGRRSMIRSDLLARVMDHLGMEVRA